MGVKLETFEPERHDKNAIADLIFQSDEEMNSLVYGKNAAEVIRKLLEVPDSYFVPEYTKCALLGEKLVGVVVSYPVSQMKEVDKVAGQGFMKALGLFSFLTKMSLYTKMAKMLGGNLDRDGLYIHTLCVDSKFRGMGLGTEILADLAKENEKMYLYVNAKNQGAIRFYKKNGFNEGFHGKMKYRGEEYGEFLMERK